MSLRVRCVRAPVPVGPRHRVEKTYGARGTLDHDARAALPLTPLQQAAYDALTADPQRARAIAAAANLTHGQANGALAYLQGKSRARRTAGGWIREPDQEDTYPINPGAAKADAATQEG